VFRDYRQQDARGRVWLGPALLPVPQCGGRDDEACGELRLTEAHLPPDFAHVYLRHVDQGHSHVVVLSFSPCDSLLESLDNALTNGLGLSNAPPDLDVFFVLILDSLYTLPGYPATSIGTKRFMAFRSALLRFAFRFFRYAESRNTGKRSL
jgi:hypothetical protein